MKQHPDSLLSIIICQSAPARWLGALAQTILGLPQTVSFWWQQSNLSRRIQDLRIAVLVNEITLMGRKSLSRELLITAADRVARWQAVLKQRLSVRSRHLEILQGLIVALIVAMPMLQDWNLLIPLWLLLYVTHGEQKLPVSQGLLLLGAIFLVSAVFSDAGLKRSSIELYQYLGWFFLAWLVKESISAEFARKITYYLVGSSLLWLGVGCWQYLCGTPTSPGWLSPEQAQIIIVRIHSIFGNPNIYALYLLITMVLTIELLLETDQPRLRLAWGFIVLITVISLYLTYSRMAWFIGGLYWLLRFGKKIGHRGLLICSLVVVLLLTLPGFQTRVVSLLVLSDSSLNYRWRIWQGVLAGLQTFWLWGAGPGRFGDVYAWYQMGAAEAGHAHQWYLQFWLEHGVLSLIGLGLVLRNCLKGFTTMRGLAQAMAVVMIIYLLYGITESWDVNPFLGGYFWLVTGIVLASKKWPSGIVR